MPIAVDHGGPVPVVRLLGEHDHSSAGEVRLRILGELVESEAVVVDLSDATFLDLGVFDVLVQAHRAAERLGGRLQAVIPDQESSFAHRIAVQLLPEAGAELHSSPTVGEAVATVEEWRRQRGQTRTASGLFEASGPGPAPYDLTDFLKALVFYLAGRLRLQEGGRDADLERLGFAVGARMEEAFRRAHGVRAPSARSRWASWW